MSFAYLSGIDGFILFAAYAIFVGVVALAVRTIMRRNSAKQSALQTQIAATTAAPAHDRSAVIPWA